MPEPELDRAAPRGFECNKCCKHPAGQTSVLLNDRPKYGGARAGEMMHRLAETSAEQEEADLRRAFSRRIRSASPCSPGGGRMHAHRELFPGQVPESPMAGEYNRDLEERAMRGRQAWQGRAGDAAAPRLEAAAAISPRAGENQPQAKISNSQRADGEFKQGFSAQAEKLSAHWSPSLFRYEPGSPITPRSPRARSVPPEGDITPTAGKSTEKQERGLYAWQHAAQETSRSPSPRGARLNNSSAVAETTDLDAAAAPSCPSAAAWPGELPACTA